MSKADISPERDNGYEGVAKRPRLQEEENRRVYEDEFFGQYPALPVGIPNDEDEDDDEDSKQVMEYLKSVRREAEKEHAVYYSDKREEETAISQAGERDDEPTTETLTKLVLWQDNLVAELVTIKQSLAQYNWKSMAFENIHLPETAVLWRKYILENEPYPIQTFYTTIDRSTIFKLIVYFTKWLSVSTTSNLSKWIYTVFLRIDNLLDPNECSVIRDLGKKAVKLAPRLTADNSTDVSHYTVDMIIAIVGNYYGQRDLLGSSTEEHP